MTELQFTLSAEYSCFSETLITLPDGKGFKDIIDYHVKLGLFHYTLDGFIWSSIKLETQGDVDTKTPDEIYILNDGGDVLYSTREPIKRRKFDMVSFIASFVIGMSIGMILLNFLIVGH